MDLHSRPAIVREIRRLIKSWRREEGREFEMKTDLGLGRGVLIWGITKHAVELTESVLVLEDAGRTKYSGALVRLLLECAITTTWVQLRDDSDSALMFEFFRSRRNALADLPATFQEADVEVLREIAEQLEFYKDFQTLEGAKIAARAKSIRGGDELYLYYRILSGASHAGASLAEEEISAFEPTQEHPVGIRLGAEQDPKYETNLLGLTLVWLTLCMRACNAIDQQGRQKAQVEDAIRKIGMKVPLGLAEPESSEN